MFCSCKCISITGACARRISLIWLWQMKLLLHFTTVHGDDHQSKLALKAPQQNQCNWNAKGKQAFCVVTSLCSTLEDLLFAPLIFSTSLHKHPLVETSLLQSPFYWHLSDWRTWNFPSCGTIEKAQFSSKIKYESFMVSLSSGTKTSLTAALFRWRWRKAWNSSDVTVSASAFRLAPSPAFSPWMRRHWKTFHRTGFNLSMGPIISWHIPIDNHISKSAELFSTLWHVTSGCKTPRERRLVIGGAEWIKRKPMALIVKHIIYTRHPMAHLQEKDRKGTTRKISWKLRTINN